MLRSPVRDFDLHLLRVFRTVVESRGITPAAEQLDVSVSTVSEQIGDLEQRLGFRLCTRGRQGFSLTAEGRETYAAALTLFGQVEDFRCRLGAMRGDLVGTLRLAVVSAVNDIPELRLPDALRRFKDQAPKVVIELSCHPVHDVQRQVVEEIAEIGLTIAHDIPATLVFTEVCKERVSLYCAPPHPLFDRAPHDLDPEDVEAVDRVYRGYIHYVDARRRRRRASRSAKANDLESAAMLVLTGHYVGYLPDHYARKWRDAGLVRPLLPDRFRYVNTIGYLLKRARPVSTAAQAFLDEWARLLAVSDGA